MITQIFPSGPFDTNAIYLSENGKVVFIDPAPASKEKLIQALKDTNSELTAIWLTHSHWDHIGDVYEILQDYFVDVYVHPLDKENLSHPGSDGLPLFFPIKGIEHAKEIKDNDKLYVGNIEFVVIHTPGHTPGGVCFYSKQERVLISGDTLFKGSIGNLSFPTAEPEKMWPSLDRLKDLDPNTKVIPGHGEITTLKQESWLNEAKQIFGGLL